MPMEMRQQLKLSQQLVMTQQLQMAIKLLQLNRLELVEAVEAEMKENPLLEESQENPDDTAGMEVEARTEPLPTPPDQDLQEVKMDSAQAEKASADMDIDWERLASESSWQPPSGNMRQGLDDLPSYEQTATRAETLAEHVLWQLRMTEMNELELEIASRVVGDLDEMGYLRTREDDGEAENPVTTIADELEVPEEWVLNVLKRIQRMDPLGVGSRDLRECLLVQLDHLGYDDDDLPWKLVADHLKDVERRAFQALAKTLKVPLDAIGEAVKIIAALEPRPGRNFGRSGEATEEAQHITPDIHLEKVGDSWAIMLNEDGMPKLRISRFYVNQMRGAPRGDPGRAYVQERLRSATWLIRSIHQRQRTIYKVMESILKHQREFFEKGSQHLKPLILRDVADDIGMHESTVSRVTTNTYVQTPQGIFELKYFFNSTIRGTGVQDDLASEAVKQHIKELIDREDPKKPLSDQQIVDVLKERSIDIARRTVAKYREVLGILPSGKRKDVFGTTGGKG